MKLEGSCHCGAVKFSLISHTPYPYGRCYCTICRKTGGGGGYVINIMGDAGTLEIAGKDKLSVYRSRKNHHDNYDEDGLGYSRRHFCSLCGSALWVWNSNYADWVYPFASAIDTPLPEPPEQQHIMLEFKASWVAAPGGDEANHFAHYPDDGIEGWHKSRGLYED